jgi:hypothetical protein
VRIAVKNKNKRTADDGMKKRREEEEGKQKG